MLTLAATTDKLQLITGAAGSIDVHASYEDRNISGANASAGRQNTNITTATTTDIVAAPGSSSIVRRIPNLNVRNAHASSSCDVTVVFNQNGTSYTLHKVTLRAGECLEYVEGVGWYLLSNPVTSPLMKVLAADDTGGSNGTSAQPWFPTSGAVAVGVGTYQMSGLLSLSRSAGTTSHTTSLLFGGTATLSSIYYKASWRATDSDAAGAENSVTARVATATVAKAASTSASEQATIEIDGIVRVSAAGTLIPQFQYSAAPGGAPTVKANSYFRLDYLGDASFATQGTWS